MSFTPLKTLITDFSHARGLETIMFEHYLKREWLQIVGTPLADHTRPDSIKFRKLFLMTENSVWLQQLVFLKPMLLEKIQALVGGTLVSDIVLRIGEIPLPPSVSDGPMSVSAPAFIPIPTPTLGALTFAKALTESLQDKELRTLLTNTIAKALSFKAPRPSPRDPSSLS